jgi:condensin complex subunit 2
MVNENKISTKNAFDLHLIDHMDDIVDEFMGGSKAKKSEGASNKRASQSRPSKAPATEEEAAEHRFHEASCTIEASARIYACRVDCVHTDTYRVLGGLSAGIEEEEAADGTDGPGKKKRRICGVNTLERNEASIIQQHFEADEQSDPMFRRMAAAFDAGGAKGLLLSHLPIAEDLSLVFNGDIAMSRAPGVAKDMFSKRGDMPVGALGLGDSTSARQKISESNLCSDIDGFRQAMWGALPSNVPLPDALENLLGSAAMGGGSAVPTAPDMVLEDGAPGVDDFPAADDAWNNDMDIPGPMDDPMPPASDPVTLMPTGNLGATALPLADMEPLGGDSRRSKIEDVIAFDELFEKFCGGGGSNQFAYFDQCWGRQKDPKACIGAIQDAEAAGGDAAGTLVPAGGPEPKEKKEKRPLFDLTTLDKPAKPIETEPTHKHQLSERAAHWQLHKDVPPYMIDRITMPSWPTWSKCDFACLGLRPHLMLKLVRKPQPAGEGPHSFSDLFSTVVVENPDAYPWLVNDSRAGRGVGHDDDVDEIRGTMDAEFGAEIGEEDFDGAGMPTHLDMDPQDLFLGPNDKVVPGCDDDGAPDVDGFDNDGSFEPGFEPGADFGLVDAPTKVGDTSIAYSRNSKFVDVKLVKKLLWECINEDVGDAKAAGEKEAQSSFQGLVNRTCKRMPKTEMENLSIQVCFICALHLCNEKGLELKTDPEKPLLDFKVVGKV